MGWVEDIKNNLGLNSIGFVTDRGLLLKGCKSLWDAVQNDPLLWRSIHKDHSLRITDRGLSDVLERNQGLEKALCFKHVTNVAVVLLEKIIGSQVPTNHDATVEGNSTFLVTMIVLLILRHAQDATKSDKYMIARPKAGNYNTN
ncbi:hypothetical protein RHSIM_Rhsim12G0011800 [Rhododendron simsii]|uniref:Uncharacterized protein n=1 Tax=Rhododendron simsii TaxID=118357 RepID=A0A834G5B4_RHOSS|nr:hypothetical protein RHSIM_Rhsim12G0011800 [Rhododendron simsii]